jgi:dGTPase
MKSSVSDDPTQLAFDREAALLASYAQHSAASAGRRYPEPSHPYRGPYQRDRDRILHSAAFRRLSQKTQVFTGEMGDYHRTRLTHTLEVASIARTIARALRLNEDLVEALALAHDIGHPPFGHSGEDVLNECLSEYGGFTHNAQALRIFEVLETRYPQFSGLNLTVEVLEGQRTRIGNSIGQLPSDSPLLEVQALDAADSIAYDAHDADDALEIGLLRLDELLAVPMWREANERVARRFSNVSDRHLRRAIVHEVIDWQVSDIVTVARRELAERRIASVAEARKSPHLVHASAELAEKKSGLEQFLFDRVYRHPGVLAKRAEAQEALREMFQALLTKPDRLPLKFKRLAERHGLHRAIGDYLAGMTDRFALVEHQRLVGR